MQENTKENKTEKKEGAFSQISAKSFIMIMALLTVIIILSGVLTYVIPQGKYLMDEAGVIIKDSFEKGEVQGLAIWRIITAPVRVFASSDSLTVIMISVFLLVMSGVFNLLEKTGGVRVIIGKTVKRFSKNKEVVVCAVALIFMAFGSFFGMFEELVTLLPLVVVLMLSMGFDTLTGLGVCMMSACFGFSAALTNPFSVGIISGLEGQPVFSGVWLRIVLFALIYAMICLFLIMHVRKISKNPEKSLTYEIDQRKRAALDISESEEFERDKKIFKVFGLFFAVQIVVLVLVAVVRAISGYAIPILAVSFLVGGIITGLCVCEKKKDVFSYIGQGALAMIPAIVMIAFASSVKLIMEESGILATIMHGVISFLDGKSPFICVVLIYFLILFLQIFIGSSSAKIMLIMPIILPIAKALGISPNVIILTYCIADGFTDVILPTNPVLLIGLSMANVSYGQWLKWTWKVQVSIFVATVLMLLFAIKIGY